MQTGLHAAMVLIALVVGGCVRGGFGLSSAERRSADYGLGTPDRGVWVSDGSALDVGDGLTWTELGSSARGLGVSGRRALARLLSIGIGTDGQPIVAWSDDRSGNAEVYLRQWTAAGWSGLGSSADDGGVSNTPGTSQLADLLVDASGHVVVSWTEQGSAQGQGAAYLRRWDDTGQWVEVGGSATAGGLSQQGSAWWPSLTMDAFGRLIAAWEVYAVKSWGVIYLKRLEGTAWVEVAGSASGTGLAGEQSSAYCTVRAGPSGTLHLIWQEQRDDGTSVIVYRRGDGNRWEEPRVISNPGENSNRPNLAVGSDDNPVVIWQVGDDWPALHDQVRLRRWTGQTWVGLGGSDQAPGLSVDTTYGRYPNVVVDTDGRIVVAWEADDAQGTNIYVRRWEGDAWVDLADPTLGASVSASNASHWPNLAAGPNGLNLIWEEWLDDQTSALYLRHLPR